MFKAIAMKLGLRAIGKQARDIAEGKSGERAKAIYLWFLGKKRVTGIFFGCVCAALVALNETPALEFVTGTLAVLFTSLGFIDSSWRQEPKLDSTWLRFLRDHAMDVSAVMAALSGLMTTCPPWVMPYLERVHMTCADGATLLVVVAAVLAHLGVQATAQSAQPPSIG